MSNTKNKLGRQTLGENDIYRPNSDNKIPNSTDSSIEKAAALIEKGYIDAYRVAQLTYKTRNRCSITSVPTHTPQFLAYVERIREMICAKYSK